MKKIKKQQELLQILLSRNITEREKRRIQNLTLKELLREYALLKKIGADLPPPQEED